MDTRQPLAFPIKHVKRSTSGSTHSGKGETGHKLLAGMGYGAPHYNRTTARHESKSEPSPATG
jgi:hypothetical protein